MSLVNISKILKCAQNEDCVTLRADESHDVLELTFESNSTLRAPPRRAHTFVRSTDNRSTDVPAQRAGSAWASMKCG